MRRVMALSTEFADDIVDMRVAVAQSLDFSKFAPVDVVDEKGTIIQSVKLSSDVLVVKNLTDAKRTPFSGIGQLVYTSESDAYWVWMGPFIEYVEVKIGFSRS
jgi:hypothetical protein